MSTPSNTPYKIDAILSEIWGPWEQDGKKGQGGFVISWSAEGIGWGELTFSKKEDGTVVCDNEIMGAEFCKAVLSAFLDSTKMLWVYKDGDWKING